MCNLLCVIYYDCMCNLLVIFMCNSFHMRIPKSCQSVRTSRNHQSFINISYTVNYSRMERYCNMKNQKFDFLSKKVEI